MLKAITAVLIWSSDYQKLAQWYQDKLNLQTVEKLTHPKDTGILYRIGKVYLWIGRHSEVTGKNKDKYRHMFNIQVDSVSREYESLKTKGVKFLAVPFKAPTMNSYFATFYDLDNNLVQLIGKK
ncbi:VOC family protein [Candidatus Roizmanbacteria bacterium]|nr:VOC family protein [Candidatus Roizmanbacteria bacterium]